MKQIFLALAVTLTMLTSYAAGNNVKFHISVNDGNDSATVIGLVSDSDSIADFSVPQPLTSSTYYSSNESWSDIRNRSSNVIPIVSIITVFGLPVFIIAIVMWFRYKNNQAKYRLAAEAISAGKDIPKELFKEPARETQIFNKGIKNTFFGIGLGVFLWLLTGEEGLAAIGFLIFCVGISQIIIGYLGKSTTEHSSVSELDKFKNEFTRRKAEMSGGDDLNNDEKVDRKE